MFSKNCENYSDFDFGGFFLLAFLSSSPDFPAPKLINNREKNSLNFTEKTNLFLMGKINFTKNQQNKLTKKIIAFCSATF